VSKPRFRKVKQGKVDTSYKQKVKVSDNSDNAIKIPTKKDFFKAFITDTFMLLMPIMYIVFYLVMGSREGFAEHKLEGWILILIPYYIIVIIFLAKASQTPGMRAYNLVLVDSTTYKKPSLIQIIFREFFTFFDFILFGWILMFFRKDHKMPHELLSGTMLIVKEEKE